MLEGDLFALNDANQVAGVNFIIILQICALVMHLLCGGCCCLLLFSLDFCLLASLSLIRSPGANKAECNAQLVCDGKAIFIITLFCCFGVVVVVVQRW